jgi:hypothetical protein
MATNYMLRLEPRARSAALEPGVAARVYDPAWMIGRQWQLGEMLGDDAGTPVGLELRAEVALVAQWQPATAAGYAPYDPADGPLEALVEAEPLRTAAWTARMRVDAGREFLQMLRDSGLEGYVPDYIDVYQIGPATAELRTLDVAGSRLLDVVSGRIPDGEEMYRELGAALAQGTWPAAPELDPLDANRVQSVAIDWMAWCAATVLDGDGQAWDPLRLEYGFSVATGDPAAPTVLDASEYRGGRLDWYSFDVRPVGAASAFTPLDPIDVLPTGIRFRGMPNARWWEFEDASIDMGSVDGGPSDVARLALLEFALLYGNDFFAVPLSLPVGSLTRIKSLIVADTFGFRLAVQAATRGSQRVGADRWTMFTLAQRGPATSGPADLLFLPPVAGPILGSELVEDVLLLRDEMANLAWAVERTYEGESGGANNRAEAAIRESPAVPPRAGEGGLRYQLGTSVPHNWFPLVPLLVGGQLRLDLQRMADQLTNPQATPRGHFLNLVGPPIHEEEVPREGARLSRDYVMTRWTNGATLLWSRRRKRVGRGEGSSGLRFDVTELRPPDSTE